jgi:twitching motility protein PilT
MIAQFKSSKWATPAEVEAFVLQCGKPDSQSILKLLDLLAAKGAASDLPLHKRRCTVFSLVVQQALAPELFLPFVKALKTADPVLRACLATLIPKVNNISEHAELCGLLAAPDPPLRAVTAQLLAQLGGKTVNQALRSMLKDKGFTARAEAIEVLVRISGHYALPVLQEILANGRPADCLIALKYLGDPEYMGKEAPRALQCIAPFVNDPNEQIALQAINSFGRMCTEDDFFETLSPSLEAAKVNLVKAAVEPLKRFSSPRVLMVLERKLRAGPNAVRFTVLNVLEAIGTNEILSAVVEGLGHKQIMVRTRAGEVLARLSQAGKLDPSRTIVYLLKSKDVNVRRMAIELARSVKDPNSDLWPKLLGVLRDEDWWVRERVVDVLVEMAGPQLTRHICVYLSDPSDVVRRYAANVLARLKDPASLGALVRMADADPDWWAREKAVEAIAAINDPRALPYLLEVMARDPEMRWICLQALAEMNAKTTAPQVLPLLQDASADVRLAAMRCLQKFDDPSHAAAVQPLVGDPEIGLRTVAREILAHWNIVASAELVLSRDSVSPLDRLLIATAKQEGDDLILACERHPMMKRLGKTLPLTKSPLTSAQVKSLLLPKLSASQMKELEELRDVDFSYEVKSDSLRFRANVFQDASGIAAVFRIIKGTVPDIEKLGLPPVVIKLGELKNGLVLVGGPTGSGKSTTLAALVNYINRKYGRHIISLEDPIEVLHPSIKSLVTQREIGTHTQSFGNALRATLREDPNVILVGELRDLATISFAVTAAETGHLVFGTVHTVSADTTVDRMINAFPARQQETVRSMLAESLRAVCCQFLLRHKDGVSRCLAMETMINNDAISALIRKGKAYQIPSVVATAREEGMQLMDTDLMRLFKEGKVPIEEAYVKARSKRELEAFMPSGAPSGQPGAGAGAEAAQKLASGGASRASSNEAG